MLRTSLITGLGLVSAAIAQAPIDLPAFGSTFTGSLTRGFFFQCPVACKLTALEVPNEANQPNQVVEFIEFGASPPPAFPANVVGTQRYFNNTSPAGTLISININLTAGTWYGVLGACTASPGAAFSYNSYGSPAGPFVTDILGNPVTIARMGTQSGIASNGGNQACWSEIGGPIGRVHLHICGAPTPASFTQFGDGCAGTLGVPDLIPVTGNPLLSPLPQLGTTFGVECIDAPQGVAFMITGVRNTSWTGGALPQDGTSIGAPGCFLRVGDSAVNLMPVMSSTTTGWVLQLPNLPGLQCTTFYCQALVLSLGTNTANWVTSNSYVLTVGL